MVDKKFKDFDAAVSEADGEKVTFKIAGSEYELQVNYQHVLFLHR